MLTPDYLQSCTDAILALYERFQTSILEDMARRMVRMGHVSSTSVYQAHILQESGLLFDDVMRELAALLPESDTELAALFRDAGTQTLQYDDRIYRAQGLHPLPFNQSEGLLNI